jgi:hypothetical protein
MEETTHKSLNEGCASYSLVASNTLSIDLQVEYSERFFGTRGFWRILGVIVKADYVSCSKLKLV